MEVLDRNRLLKKQLELAPLRIAVNSLSQENYDDRIKRKKTLLTQIKLYDKLEIQNETLIRRVQMEHYVRLKRLRNMIDPKTIPDKLHDLEWSEVFTEIRARIFEMEAEEEFYKEQLDFYSDLLYGFEKTYKDHVARIEQEKDRSMRIQEEKSKLKSNNDIMSDV